jgi:hypothetical protein
MLLTAMGFNFDEFKSGGHHENHTVPAWNFGTISAFASRQRNSKMAGHRTFLMRTDF